MKQLKHYIFCMFTLAPLQTITAQNWNQKEMDINGEAADYWSGYSVSMPHKNTVAIGALLNSQSVAGAGQVRVYRLNDNTWTQKGLDIDGVAAGDWFGRSVSMPDTNTIAVGAPFADGSGIDMGITQIYKWTGSAWVQKGLDILGEADNDQSGSSVSMPDSNTVAIGAIYNAGNSINPGHVRIYKWDGNAWIQKGTDIDGETDTDQAGYFVSMPDSNTVAIGAPLNSDNGFCAGQVRIYRWDGNAWVQKGIDIDGDAVEDWLGLSVNMPDSNTVVVGAPNNDANGNNVGQVRIYHWNGNAWIQKGLSIYGVAIEDQAGYSVNMPDSNTVAIDSHGNDDSGINAGHVRIFKWNGSAWVQKGLSINGEAADDISGLSISMADSGAIAIGSPWNDVNGNKAGQVRVYYFCANTTSTISPKACVSYVSPSGTYTLTNSGTYYDTINNSTGCDSIITINLMINTNTSNTISATACNSYVSPSGNYTLTNSGIYNDIITNSLGCDSIITINLTINKVTDISTSTSGAAISANNTNATYQWLACNNSFAVIAGATNQSYSPLNNGNYAVELTENGCVDTSICVNITSVGVADNIANNKFVIYPNPTKGEFTIVSDNEFNNTTLIMRNVMGQEVFREKYSSTKCIDITLEAARGIYFIELIQDEKKRLLKLIKE